MAEMMVSMMVVHGSSLAGAERGSADGFAHPREGLVVGEAEGELADGVRGGRHDRVAVDIGVGAVLTGQPVASSHVAAVGVSVTATRQPRACIGLISLNSSCSRPPAADPTSPSTGLFTPRCSHLDQAYFRG